MVAAHARSPRCLRAHVLEARWVRGQPLRLARLLLSAGALLRDSRPDLDPHALRPGPLSSPSQVFAVRRRRRTLVLHPQAPPVSSLSSPCFLVWIFVTRTYRILAGGLAAMAIGAIVTTLIDPAAWAQYAYYVRTSVMTREFTPCLGRCSARFDQPQCRMACIRARRFGLRSGPCPTSGRAEIRGIGSKTAARSCSFQSSSRPLVGSLISPWRSLPSCMRFRGDPSRTLLAVLASDLHRSSRSKSSRRSDFIRLLTFGPRRRGSSGISLPARRLATPPSPPSLPRNLSTEPFRPERNMHAIYLILNPQVLACFGPFCGGNLDAHGRERQNSSLAGLCLYHQPLLWIPAHHLDGAGGKPFPLEIRSHPLPRRSVFRNSSRRDCSSITGLLARSSVVHLPVDGPHDDRLVPCHPASQRSRFGRAGLRCRINCRTAPLRHLSRVRAGLCLPTTVAPSSRRSAPGHPSCRTAECVSFAACRHRFSYSFSLPPPGSGSCLRQHSSS